MPETITDTRMQEILEGDETWAIQFYADWAPAGTDAFKSTADGLKGIQFGMVNVGEHTEAGKALDIESIPTIVILHGGDELDRRARSLSEPAIKNWIVEQTGATDPSKFPSENLP